LNGKQIVLTDQELEMINRIRKGKVPHGLSDQYPDYDDWFTRDKEVSALGNPQEPKARFVPSKHEARMVARLVNAMLNGRIQMPSMKAEEDKKRLEEEERGYLMWAQDGHAIDQGPGRSKPPSSIPPPKPSLPG
jgi:ribosome biogenesis protein ERB1